MNDIVHLSREAFKTQCEEVCSSVQAWSYALNSPYKISKFLLSPYSAVQLKITQAPTTIMYAVRIFSSSLS